MELVFVRHAEPEWVREGLSVDNPPLTARGEEQARLLAKRLGDERFDAVLVSPLVRAKLTAEPLLDVLDARHEVLPWMAEIGMPDWTGTPSAEVDRIFAEAMARPFEQQWDGIEGGESFRDFHVRVTTGIREVLGQLGGRPTPDETPLWHLDRPDARLLLVAHAGTNATVVGHLLGFEPVPWEWERIVTQHASVTSLRGLRIGHGWSFALDRLSDVEHLPPELRTR